MRFFSRLLFVMCVRARACKHVCVCVRVRPRAGVRVCVRVVPCVRATVDSACMCICLQVMEKDITIFVPGQTDSPHPPK